MGRIIGPTCKMCRREGEKLCNHAKCALTRRKYAPGMSAAPKKRARMTEYGHQLRAKQKAKRIYGVMERQFKKIFRGALKGTGNTRENLLRMLELRLDNVVFRLGFAPSRPAARQMVGHGHILVNGKKVTIPSYQLKVADTVTLKESKRNSPRYADLEGMLQHADTLPWLALQAKEFSGKIVDTPNESNMTHSLDLQLIVEFYSR